MTDSEDPALQRSFTMYGGADADEMWGPTQADDAVRQALAAVWRSLPKHRRDPDTIEKHMRRLLDRTLRNYREDIAAFSEHEG